MNAYFLLKLFWKILVEFRSFVNNKILTCSKDKKVVEHLVNYGFMDYGGNEYFC